MRREKRDYVVEYNVSAIQSVVVSNCRSKAEAIRKAFTHAVGDDLDINGMEFSVDNIHKSTARAWIDGEWKT